LVIFEGENFKLCRLTRLMAYVFDGVAYKFCGGLWLGTFHGGLRRRLWGLLKTMLHRAKVTMLD